MNLSPIDFSIGYQNIDGLHTKTFSCKLPYLQSKLIHDIEVFSEAWGGCEHSKDMPGYEKIEVESTKKTNVKKGRSSGGILIYCKKHLFKVKRLSTSGLKLTNLYFMHWKSPLRYALPIIPPPTLHIATRISMMKFHPIS